MQGCLIIACLCLLLPAFACFFPLLPPILRGRIFSYPSITCMFPVNVAQHKYILWLYYSTSRKRLDPNTPLSVLNTNPRPFIASQRT